jgi:hypothetical protein
MSTQTWPSTSTLARTAHVGATASRDRSTDALLTFVESLLGDFYYHGSLVDSEGLYDRSP